MNNLFDLKFTVLIFSSNVFDGFYTCSFPRLITSFIIDLINIPIHNHEYSFDPIRFTKLHFFHQIFFLR